MRFLRSRWRYLFALVALLLLFVAVGPSEIGSVLSEAHLGMVGGYVVGLAVTSLLYATQIWMALRFAGHPIGWWTTASASISSWSVGLITPARAGDLTLPVFLGDAVPRGASVAVVATEKLMSLAWLAMVALIVSAGLALDTAAITIAAGIVLSSILGALAVARTNLLARLLARWGPSSVRRFAVDTAASMAEMLRQPRFLAFTVGAISVRWMAVFGLNLLLFRAVDYQPGLLYVAAATSIGRLLSLIPVSVGGLGVKEPVQIVIYALADVPAEAVVAVSVLGAVGNYLVAALLPIMVRKRTRVVSE